MTETTLPKLLVSKEEARQQIEARIQEGQQFRDREIYSDDELDDAIADFVNWSEYNIKLLLLLFDNSLMVDEYNEPYNNENSWSSYDLDFNIRKYRREITTKIKRLGGIRDQIELFKDPSDTPQSTFGNDVFIVHGHDQAAKHAIAEFVRRLGLNPIILDEQANKGQTIIEKFEENADEVGFAIVLLTPDDVGAPKDKQDEFKSRARQNVVLELGYFMGKLGRERVCPLLKDEVEKPSDIDGLVYVPMDNFNGWQLKLAKEMKQAGLPVDSEKLL